MEATLAGYIGTSKPYTLNGTTVRIQSFIPNQPKVSEL